MRCNFLIGGKAGQGVNKISEIFSDILVEQGYFIFNYRDYPSLIRGGHNFNIISVSNEPIKSFESVLDGILALDKKTIELHKKNLKKNGFVVYDGGFEKFGRNMNIALLGVLIKILGIDKKAFVEKIKKEFDEKAVKVGEEGFKSQEKKFEFKKLKKKISLMSGSKAVALGALNSDLNLYIAYPMTPATGVMHELAAEQSKKNLMVFQAENEIAVANSALGAGFAGAKVMIGSSGGGFDLMCEALSFQGQSEIPLTIYLAMRPGPGTGVPTYTSQADLDIALRGGHGEFPRVVVAPGDALECFKTTNEALYLANKFNILSIIISDKHLAESQYSFSEKIPEALKIPINRKIPSQGFVKASGYEHNKFGYTTEDTEIIKKNAEARKEKYQQLKKACEEFKMYKIYGNKTSENLIISWGSTKGAVLDAIKNLDCKFLQIIYIKPISNKIKKEVEKSSNVILIENNVTGQLGRLLREKTGFSIPEKNRILKYDGRPFTSNELKKEIKERLR